MTDEKTQPAISPASAPDPSTVAAVAEAPAPAADGEAAPLPESLDEEGLITHAFREAVSGAIAAGDRARLVALTEDLHEADMAELISVLAADQRPDLVHLLGDDFDFSALVDLDETERVQLLEDLPVETVAEEIGRAHV